MRGRAARACGGRWRRARAIEGGCEGPAGPGAAGMVDGKGLEPSTSALRTRRSPN